MKRRGLGQPADVVVVVVGKSDAHAALAVLYFALEVTVALGVVVLPAVLAGNVTPCSVMQLRYAANAVEVALEAPAPPPPKPAPAGRKLAQALKAVLVLELPPNPPAGADPLGLAPPGAPLPKPDPVTPCCFRQFVNAALDAVFDEEEEDDEDEEDFDVVDVDFEVEDVDDAPLLPQAASTTPARATAANVPATLRILVLRLNEWMVLVMEASMQTESGQRIRSM